MRNKPFNGKLDLPQLFRKKILNELLLCVEVLAHGKTSEPAGQKELLVTLWTKAIQDPVMGYWSKTNPTLK